MLGTRNGTKEYEIEGIAPDFLKRNASDDFGERGRQAAFDDDLWGTIGEELWAVLMHLQF